MPVAVIGDIAGHADELVRALRGLGADPATLTLPADVTVIQVGNLTQPGPAGEAVLDLVELQLASGRWVQLVGSQEAAEVGGAVGPGHRPLPEADAKRIRSWWDDGRLRAAAAVRLADHPSLLVTHAGLTHGMWYDLRSPTSAELAASKLADVARTDPERFFRGGCGLGSPRSMAAGPVWAACAEELYPSLSMGLELGKPVPFGQVHGHSGPYHWNRGTWRAAEGDRVALRLVRDRRQVVGTVAGQAVAAVDPELGAAGGLRWAPLVLAGATIADT